MEMFLIVYISGYVVAFICFGIDIFKDWYRGKDISLGEIVFMFVASIASWFIAIPSIIHHFSKFLNSDVVIIKGRKNGKKETDSNA